MRGIINDDIVEAILIVLLVVACICSTKKANVCMDCDDGTKPKNLCLVTTELKAGKVTSPAEYLH